MKAFLINEDNVGGFADKMGAWIKEKVSQANCKGVVLGMSGGIDCSVVARLCQVGGVDVQLVLMPYGDDMKNSKSYDHAMSLIEKFNFPHSVFDIKPAIETFIIPICKCSEAAGHVATNPSDDSCNLSYANVRPRVRMTCLYLQAQRDNRLVIGAGNLAERTVGYFTKWGDGACDLNPLAMLTKQEVYTLARYLEIPDCIINKKPSAGLWDGQTDEDELGLTYAAIDAFILNSTSGDTETDRKITDRIAGSAHKHAFPPIFEGG